MTSAWAIDLPLEPHIFLTFTRFADGAIGWPKPLVFVPVSGARQGTANLGREPLLVAACTRGMPSCRSGLRESR